MKFFAVQISNYLTIRLRARDFYAVVVDEGEAHQLISELPNFFNRIKDKIIDSSTFFVKNPPKSCFLIQKKNLSKNYGFSTRYPSTNR